MKRISILLMLSYILCSVSSAQKFKTIYFDSTWQEVKNGANAKYYRHIWKDKDSLKNKIYIVEDFYSDNKIQMRGSFLDKNAKVKNGKFLFYYENGNVKAVERYLSNFKDGLFEHYYENGKIESEVLFIHNRIEGEQKAWHLNGEKKLLAHYKKGVIVGTFQSFYPDGKLARKDFYIDGQFISGNCYSKNGSDTTYFPYVIMPIFKGGMSFGEYVQRNMKYPRGGSIYGVNGRAVVRFMVDIDGSVCDAVISSSDNPVINEEALRVVINSPKWKPGKTDGVVGQIYMEVPIVFRAR